MHVSGAPAATPELYAPVEWYNVQMKRYSASEARKRISDVLDGAEQGEAVVIERKGVRFRVVVDRAGPARALSRGVAPSIEILDPEVESGNWTWRLGRRGLAFVARASTSRALRRSR